MQQWTHKKYTIIKRQTTRLGAKHKITFCNPSPEMGTSLYNIFKQETIYRNSIIGYSYQSAHQIDVYYVFLAF